MRRWIFGFAAAALFLILAAQTAQAQNAQVVGVARDQTGGVLPGVTVTAKNAETFEATRLAVGTLRTPGPPHFIIQPQ